MNSAIANRISIVLSFVGMFLAGVLSLSKFYDLPVPCGGSEGCQDVTSHASAYWFGQPVAYYGLAAYTFFAAVFILRGFLGPKKLLVVGPLAIAGIGAIIHVGLAIYAETVIQKTCWWCLGSMSTMVALFLTQAVFAQTQAVFMRRQWLDVGLTVLCAVAATAGVAIEGVLMRGGKELAISPQALGLMTVDKLAPAGVPSYGDVNAPVVIVEFGDFFCPACRKTYPVVKKIVDKSGGGVRLAFRHFPLVGETGHEMSWPAAMLSVKAAEMNKFWEFADMVSETPKEDVPTIDDLMKLSADFGVDVPDLPDRIKAAEADPLFKRVWDDLKIGSDVGVLLTPTYIVLAPGERPRAVVGMAVQELLQQPRYQRYFKNAGG